MNTESTTVTLPLEEYLEMTKCDSAIDMQTKLDAANKRIAELESGNPDGATISKLKRQLDVNENAVNRLNDLCVTRLELIHELE